MVVMVLLAPGSSFQAPDLYDKITKGDFFSQKWDGVVWRGIRYVTYIYSEDVVF
jgi:hypothetical protein